MKVLFNKKTKIVILMWTLASGNTTKLYNVCYTNTEWTELLKMEIYNCIFIEDLHISETLFIEIVKQRNYYNTVLLLKFFYFLYIYAN